MKYFVYSIFLALGASAIPAAANRVPDSLCAPLLAFAASIDPDAHREIVFRTSWGGNFKDATENVFYAKRCEHSGYKEAKKVCDVLMKDASVEFGNQNAMQAIVCLSPKTRFPYRTSLETGEFSLMFGSENRGANISIVFEPDTVVGGMSLRIVADGY